MNRPLPGGAGRHALGDAPVVEAEPPPILEGEVHGFGFSPDTRPSKAITGAILGFITAFVGALVTVQLTGADIDGAALLGALYAALSSAGLTGGGVYIKTNPEKV